MNPPPPSSADIRRIDLAAAEWLVKRDRGLTAAEQDEFLQWLAADARNGEWFARHEQTWTELNPLAQWLPEHSTEPNPDLLARFPRRRVTAWLKPTAFAAAAAAAFAFLAWQPWIAPPVPPTAVPAPPAPAAVRDYESRVLNDGSVVELNAGAVIVSEFRPDERRVRLLQGEAHFTVAKDSHRPFAVHARGVDVRAIGTAFCVSLERDAVAVLVTAGQVQLQGPPATPAAAARRLMAGERAVVALSAGGTPLRVEAVAPDEITRLLGWQPKLFDFNSTPLAEVITEFNRRNRVQMVIADSALGAVPIVASFRSNNVDGFVRLLELTSGVRAERSGDTITLRRAR